MQVVELGVRIAPEGLSTTIVSLFYTDSSQITSNAIVNFTVPKFYGKWMRFAFRVSKENVTLFFNCNETETVVIQRQPLELVFDSASTLYIAQAGSKIGEPYEVSDRSIRKYILFQCCHKIANKHIIKIYHCFVSNFCCLFINI